jgi:hypothetical protein
MVKHVLLVHGYAVTTFNTYGLLPKRLGTVGVVPQNIYLSAYDSLNDDTTSNDLALALAARIDTLTGAGLDLSATAVIAHSFGALVVRRWILNRWAQAAVLPSHFISLGGAHHGSTVAQLGETQLAYLYRALDGTSVGLEVLQDLDYGSEFLLQLNEEWIDAHTAANPPSVRSFSVIGDDHSDLVNQLFWQTNENGSDGTVRISGGNLNYRMLSFDQTTEPPALREKKLGYDVPHLILSGASHVGSKKGIVEGNAATMDLVFPAVKEALEVSTPEAYAALATNWRERTEAWSSAHKNDCNSTVVFSLRHPGGRHVKDALILIRDEPRDPADKAFLSDGNIQPVLNVTPSIEPPHPIQNNVTPSSISFYLNYEKFVATYPHSVEIHINSGSPEVTYPPAVYSVQTGSGASIRPNEFLYIKVTLNRQSKETYVVIPASANPDLTSPWPPMPETNKPTLPPPSHIPTPR